MFDEPEQLDGRVLLLAPTLRDAATSRSLLEAAGMTCFVCDDIVGVCREAARGAGAAVVTAESILRSTNDQLSHWLTNQPPWSDFPSIVLTPPGAESAKLLHALSGLGHMTLMQRPVQVSTFVSTVSSALRDRRRQYAVRDLLEERQRAAEALRNERERYRVTLSSIGDGVIVTDLEGRVTFLNPVAERLTGWDFDAALGHPMEEVFRIVNETTRVPVANPALRALCEGATLGLANHTMLVARDGKERPIDDSAAPLQNGPDDRSGAVLVFRDVTERRHAEQELRRKEAELSDFVENATIGLHWIGLDGAILWANRAEMDMLGYSREEYIGHKITEFHADAAVIDDILCRLSNKEELDGYEARMRCKDKSIKYVAINSSVRWENNRFVHTRCFTRDITEQKHAQEAWARLAAIVESSDDAIISKSLDGTIQSWNSAAEQLFGYTASEAIGQPITLVIPTERRDEERAILERLRRGERIDHFETERVSKDGRRIEISLTISPVHNREGQVIGASKVARDISVRKRAEEKLRDAAGAAAKAAAANAKFRAFFEQGTNFAGVLTLDGVVVEANRLCLDVCGFAREDVIGKPFWECGWWNRSQSLQGQVCAAVMQAAAGQMFRTETHFFVADGGQRMVDLILAPVRDETGQVLFVAATGSDVTQRRAMEDALREADRKKDDFIALLAHELRNPLAPIRNGLQVLRLAGLDGNATTAEARSMMERQLAHMVRLIDDLLDISRINRSKMELRRARVRLSEVVNTAVETARPAIDAEGHELIVSLPQRPVFVDADLTRLAQVFSNLLTNSAKYTQKGGRIWLSAERSGGKLVVSVRDNGIGLPVGSLENIFDMFSQVDRSIERSSGGLGIGLALVKGLVEMHGGTVAARSDGEGKGSTFTVTLPVLIPPSEELSATQSTDPAGEGIGQRILVVDDNRDGAQSLAMMLGLLNNQVETAHDGMEAVRIAESFRPDVILMDVGMPKMNGLEATRKIREQAWGHQMAIIALTGWGQEGDKERSREAGCNGHLVKPVDLSDLQMILRDLRVNAD